MSRANVFDTLRQRVEQNQGLLPQEKRAMFWFRDASTTLLQWQREMRNQSYTQLSQQKFTKQLVPPKAVQLGALYFFLYTPLNTLTLPYYDRFPLVLVIDRDADSFLGLNFHYLPYRTRAILFDALYSTRLQTRPDNLKSRLAVNYKLLNAVSKYKAFRPCLKRYRYNRVRTALLQVGETDWDLALFLPVEQFSKKLRTEVWQESLSKMNAFDQDVGAESDE